MRTAIRAIAAFAALLTLTVAAPAAAGTGVPIRSAGTAPVAALLAPPASCPNLSFCGYVDIAYRTGQGYETFPSRSGCETDLVFRNQWSSWFNNSGRTVLVYKSNNCTGEALTYYNGTGQYTYSNPTPHPTWMDNVGSFYMS